MYTEEQRMFTLAWVAYRGDPLVFGETINTAIVFDRFKTRIGEVEALRGQWEVAWGPVLHQLPFTLVTDGMMVVVRSKQDPRRLVIAIRGTNPVSLATWLFQNFLVAESIPWPFATPEDMNPQISAGMNRALAQILGLVPQPDYPGGAGSVGGPQTIVEFLAREAATQGGLDLFLTGHSLGGALASTLALALSDKRDAGVWDVEKRTSITTYSFAAPTVGNADFARYTDRMIGNQLHRIWNTRDIVPRAWKPTLMNEVPRLYPAPDAPDPVMALLVRAAAAAVSAHGYTHPESGERRFTGELGSDLPGFWVQVVHQHGQAYLDQESVEGLPLHEVIEPPPPG